MQQRAPFSLFRCVDNSAPVVERPDTSLARTNRNLAFPRELVKVVKHKTNERTSSINQSINPFIHSLIDRSFDQSFHPSKSSIHWERHCIPPTSNPLIQFIHSLPDSFHSLPRTVLRKDRKAGQSKTVARLLASTITSQRSLSSIDQSHLFPRTRARTYKTAPSCLPGVFLGSFLNEQGSIQIYIYRKAIHTHTHTNVSTRAGQSTRRVSQSVS